MRLSLILLALLLSIGALDLHAQEAPPAAPPAAPAAAPVVTPPATPPAAPAPSPEPAPTPAPPAKKEDEADGVPAPAPVEDPPQPSALSTRVSAALNALKGSSANLQALAARDRTITDLRSQLSARDATITGLNAQVATLGANLGTAQQRVTSLEAEQKSVLDTLGSLGFDQSKLPESAPVESAKDNATVYNEWQRLKKDEPAKAMAYFRTHKAALRAYSGSHPSV